jgi:hypothetical protein
MTEKEFISFLAQMCFYAQDYFPTPDTSRIRSGLKATSYTASVFLAKNTINGRSGGVAWDVVHPELYSKKRGLHEWKQIIRDCVDRLGGYSGELPQKYIASVTKTYEIEADSSTEARDRAAELIREDNLDLIMNDPVISLKVRG